MPDGQATRSDYDVVVIGAGVVGLACAARLARSGRRTLVVETHPGPGRETSSRNSGVIHAGLYYPAESWKARLCVEGRERLYAFCTARGIDHARTGKLVLATVPEEIGALEALAARGVANGAGDLRMLSRDELHHVDPVLTAAQALFSPESGIVDVHGVLDALVADLHRDGADLVFRTRVKGLDRRPSEIRVHTEGPDGTFEITAPFVISAAGLAADRIASDAGLALDERGARQHRCKGSYFALAASAPRPRTALVYPLPAGPGLGIHLTRDLGGQVRAGPDTEYVDGMDYDVDETKAESFAQAIARYLPGIAAHHLRPDYAGIRPTLRGPGEGFRDFLFVDGTEHGMPGLLSLLGIESPGLTCALAIAEHVAKTVDALGG